MKQVNKLSFLLFFLWINIAGNNYAQPILLTKQIPEDSRNFISSGQRLFFNSNDSLWTSNGTIGSTYFIKKTNETFIKITNLKVGSFIYFTTLQADGKTALWRTNGTGVNTVKIAAFPSIEPLIVFGNELYLGINDGAIGYELWKINVSNTLSLVKDINPGAGSGLSGRIVISSHKLYFAALASPGVLSIWKSNGTTAGTMPAVTLTFTGEALNLTDVNGTMFFSRNYFHDDKYTAELWKTDGTTLGTGIVKTLNDDFLTQDINTLHSHNNKLYFYLTESAGVELTSLWTSNGMEAGTSKIKDIFTDADVYPLCTINDYLFTTARYPDIFHYPLTRSDGTFAGTQDFYTFPVDFGWPLIPPVELEPGPKRLFFTYNVDRGGVLSLSDLYQTDLYQTNTKSLREIFGPSFSYPESGNLTAANDNLYFTTKIPYSPLPDERKLRLWFYNPNRPSTNIPYFSLVNAETGEDIQWIRDGDIIYKPGGLNVNIRYNPTSTPGSVKFNLNGPVYRIENVAPYALAGDLDGVYNTWPAIPGFYTLAATPYSLPNGLGTSGSIHAVSFRIINPDPTRSSAYPDKSDFHPASLSLEVYPNPSSDIFKFSLINKEEGTIRAEIYRMDGSLVEKILDTEGERGETIEFFWNGQTHPQGIYLCKYISGSSQITQKIVLYR